MIGAAQPLSYSVLVATAAILFWIAANDFRSYKIPNHIILVLVALFCLYVLVSGRWVVLHWHVGFAVIMFLLLLACYAQNLMGGGDVKLLTVAFLWTGPHCALLFLLGMMVVALVHTLIAKLGWVDSQRIHGRIKIAFAPSIAGGLIGVFMSGCLSPI